MSDEKIISIDPKLFKAEETVIPKEKKTTAASKKKNQTFKHNLVKIMRGMQKPTLTQNANTPLTRAQLSYLQTPRQTIKKNIPRALPQPLQPLQTSLSLQTSQSLQTPFFTPFEIPFISTAPSAPPPIPFIHTGGKEENIPFISTKPPPAPAAATAAPTLFIPPLQPMTPIQHVPLVNSLASSSNSNSSHEIYIPPLVSIDQQKEIDFIKEQSQLAQMKLLNQRQEELKHVRKQQKTIRKIYKTGKKQDNVKVLISNNSMREKVAQKTHEINQLPISEIRSALLKQNIIKAGSNAPDDLLRQLHSDTSLLCGTVENLNGTLVKWHNYLNK